MSRTWVLGVVLVGCVTAPPPAPHRVALAEAETRDAGPKEEPVPDDAAAAYILGFTWSSAGRSRDSLRAFHSAIASLLKHGAPCKRRDTLRIEQGLASTLARGGDKIVVGSEVGVVIANVSGKLERLVPIQSVYALESVGDGLVVALTPDDAALLDPSTATIIERIPHGQGVRQAKTLFAVWGASDGGGFIELWDEPSHKRKRTLTDASMQSFMAVDIADDARAVVGRGGNDGVIWDVATGGVILRFTSLLGVPPAFSSDGRFIAYGSADFEHSPIVGTTFLYDRSQHKVIATSHASHYPSGFAFGAKWLAVGDLRRACLLTLPQMSLIKCSAEVRPHMGPDDDLQDAHPTFVDSARAVVIETSDGSTLVAAVPTMSTLWKGRATLSVAADGTAYLVDADNRELLEVGAGSLPVRVREMEEGESAEQLRETHPREAADAEAYARVVAASCHVGGWVFPIAACGSF
jgi:hypothetical protein